MEKQAAISADEPCLYGCTHCIFAGVRQFGFRSSIDPDCMGIGFADGTCPHLLETKAADEKTSGYALIALDFFAIIISEKSSFKMTVQRIGDLC